MKVNGHIDLQENELQHLVFQAETQFPEVPKVGRIVFKEKKLYICVALNGNIPVWVPLTNTIDTYVYDQTVSSTTWTILHNLNTISPLVQIYDDNHSMIIPDSVVPLSNNGIRVTFSSAMTGRVIVMYGDIISDEGVGVLEPEKVAYTESFTSASTIVVRHNLGYYPITRLFINDNEVQPETVIHDDIFQTTITLSSAQSGIIRFI